MPRRHMTTAVPEGVKTFLLNHGQVKHLMSIFRPSLKEGDVTKCINNCTVSLSPHANKIFLRTFQTNLSHIEDMNHQWKKEE